MEIEQLGELFVRYLIWDNVGALPAAFSGQLDRCCSELSTTSLSTTWLGTGRWCGLLRLHDVLLRRYVHLDMGTWHNGSAFCRDGFRSLLRLLKRVTLMLLLVVLLLLLMLRLLRCHAALLTAELMVLNSFLGCIDRDGSIGDVASSSVRMELAHQKLLRVDYWGVVFLIPLFCLIR